MDKSKILDVLINEDGKSTRLEKVKRIYEMSLDSLVEKTEAWGDEKGITQEDNFFNQWEKAEEEFWEMTEEVELIKIGHGDMNDFKGEVGDVFVCLINVLKCANTTVEECLQLAYDKISKRKGETINGTFVKESDLKK